MKRQHNLKIRQGKPIYTSRLYKGGKMVKIELLLKTNTFPHFPQVFPQVGKTINPHRYIQSSLHNPI